jgi:heterodisulfide reductase subunit A-like polyferredoxin
VVKRIVITSKYYYMVTIFAAIILRLFLKPPMETAAYNILIVGAGIAGLSASIALVKKGYHVTILEAAPQV